jgi:hypothetical protein
MNTTIKDTKKYKVYKNEEILLQSGNHIEAAIAILTFDGRQYELRSAKTDEGTEWQLWIKTLNGKWKHASSIGYVCEESYIAALSEICDRIIHDLAYPWGFEVECLT